MLYSYNKVNSRKENVIKKVIRKRKYIYSTLLYQYCKLTLSVYKMNRLSVSTSIFSYMIQNIVDVICITNSRHQK